MRTRQTWAAVVAVVATVAAVMVSAGCGGGRDALADANASLGRIHSGTMHLRLELAVAPNDPRSRVGFEMDGPFDLSVGSASLERADLTVRDLSRPDQAPSRFVSDGTHAFVIQGGIGYQLPDDQLQGLRQGSGSTNAFTGLDIRSWVRDPAEQPPTTGGTGEPLQRVTGHLDPVAALNGIVELSGRLGNTPDSGLNVSDADAERVRSVATASSFELLTGSTDHLLRALRASVEFAASTATATGRGVIESALQRFGHLTLTLELRVDDPNRAVTVTPPAVTRPLSDLRSG